MKMKTWLVISTAISLAASSAVFAGTFRTPAALQTVPQDTQDGNPAYNFTPYAGHDLVNWALGTPVKYEGNLVDRLAYDVTDGSQRFLDAEGLADIAVNRMLMEDGAQPQFLHAGNDDDFYGGIDLPQPLERLRAVKLRHVVVEQYQLEFVLFSRELLEGLDRVGNRGDLESERLEQFLEEVEEFPVVVDGENLYVGAVGDH